MIVFTLCAILLFNVAICEGASAPCASDKVGPQHGGNGGNEYIIICPDGGTLTGIEFRAGIRVDSITLICTSSQGQTKFGPYGGKGGNAGSLKCPDGQYVSSIRGRAGTRVDMITLICRPQNDMTSNGTPTAAVGGKGGTQYDDTALAKGARPGKIIIGADIELDSIQIIYTTTPILGKLCATCKRISAIWAPGHGKTNGKQYKGSCPDGGKITGIIYQYGKRITSLTFICTSSKGETKLGPYGGNTGTSYVDKCRKGSSVSAFYGRSDHRLDAIGITCDRDGPDGGRSSGGGGSNGLHGGNGGSPFNDEKNSSNNNRAVEFELYASDEIEFLRIKYRPN